MGPMRRALAVVVVGACLLLADLPVAGGQDGRMAMGHRSRPTEEGVDDGFSVPPEDLHHVDTPHFRVHFTDVGEDRASVAFVKDAIGVLEHVWDVEVDELGWPAPLQDGDRGGDARVDVYLLDLDAGPYGYVAADADNACAACTSVHGYLVLENDYVGYAPDPAAALRATAAHEFSHLIHMGMAWDAEPWAYEATAVWMEQVVYPDADARTPYLLDFAGLPELPLTDFSETRGGFDRSYGAYVWNLWLAARHGPDLIRQAWQHAADDDGHVLAGYAEALAARGSSLDEALVAFTAATAGWEVGGFPAEPAGYPTVARSGTLSSGDVVEVELDHAAAYLVDLDVGEATTITVRGRRQVAGGVAVVATGGRSVTSVVDPTLWDGQATVSLAGIGSAGRVTLVVVNADAVLARPKRRGSDRTSYLRDDEVLVIGVDVDPGPPPKR